MLKTSALFSLLLALTSLPLAGQGFGDERPNVVLIGLHELSAEMLEHGPNLRALAEAGVVIPQGEVSVPRGLPELSVLMTGLLPQDSGVRTTDNHPSLGTSTTLQDLLRSEGYATLGAGNVPALWEDLAFDAGHAELNPRSLDTRSNLLRRLEELDADQPFFLWWCPRPLSKRDVAPMRRIQVADNLVGELVRGIRRVGRHDETLYVLVNTGKPNNNPERRRTRRAQRQSPFVFSYGNQLQRGARQDVLASNLDLFPTILDFVGIEATGLKLTGSSLRPTLEEGAPIARQRLHGALYSDPEPTVPGRSLRDPNLRTLTHIYSRDERWKYVLYLVDVRQAIDGAKLGFLFSAGDQELFDLEADPEETLNLAGVPSLAGQLKSLRQDALKWWASTGAARPPLGRFITPLEPKQKGSRAEDARPNIVLIISDDHDNEHLGFMGNQEVQMPVLDKLALAGTIFPRTQATSSRSRPALGSLLTGRYPHQTRITANTALTELRTKDSLPNLLKQAGYATFMGGRFLEENRYAMGFTAPRWEEVDAFVRRDQEPLWEFIDAQADKRPLFIWWAPSIPSEPFNAPKRFTELYTETEISVPSEFTGDPVDYQIQERALLAMDSWLDEGLGELTQKLEAQGQLENTLFCFISDNGSSNLRPSRGSVYEKGISTPLFFSFPKAIRAGQRIDALTSAVDVFPTLLDYAQVPLPKNLPGRSLRPQLEGQSLDAAEQREYLFGAGYRSPRPTGRPQPHADIYAIHARDAEWKYVFYLRNVNQENTSILAPTGLFPNRRYGTRELFHLAQDPHEYQDLAKLPEHQERIERMHAAAVQWWEETGGVVTKLFRK